MTTEFQTDAPNVEKGQVERPVVDINIGNRLKAKRVELNFDERQVATELKIPIDQVRALEANNFGYFRSKTFARGYLKAYCRFLNIETSEILSAFDSLQSSVVHNIKTVDKVINKQAKFGDPIVVLVSIVIIAVLIFLGFWWPSFSSKNSAVIDKQPVENTATADNPEMTTPPVLDSRNEEDVDSNTGAKENGVGEQNATSANSQTASKNTSASSNNNPDSDVTKDDGVTTGMSAETLSLLEKSGVNAKNVEKQESALSAEEMQGANSHDDLKQAPIYTDDIEVTFDADCWTEVRDSTGKILFSGVKSAGSKLGLTGTAPYRVVLGYARGVSSFKYKGETFDFSSYTRKDLARFELK